MNKLISEIWAVAIRDLKKGESIFTYISQMAVIIGVILLIGLGFDAFIDFSKYGPSYTQFFSSGIIVFYVAMSGIHISRELVEDRKGFLKLLMVTPISKYSILLGKMLSGFLGSLKTFLIMSIFFLFVFKMFSIIKVIEIIIFILLTVIIYNCFGLWLASLFENKKTAISFMDYLNFGTMFLSGIFFPLDAMPKIVKYICYINPLTYTVDLFRYITINEHYFSIWVNLIFLTIFGLVSFFLGIYQFDKNMRR